MSDVTKKEGGEEIDWVNLFKETAERLANQTHTFGKTDLDIIIEELKKRN